jgi:glucuronokinase
MQPVKARALPRAGLLGNPSDLYGGAGIAFTFDDFAAEVTLAPAAEVELDGELLRAAWQVFGEGRSSLPARPFSASFATSIPRQVGLAGSSAIVIAMLRALQRWFDLALEPHEVARLALRAEVDLLGIRAGPMDRLAQVWEGLVQMDFAEPFAAGSTRRLPGRLLPPLLIAYETTPKESSGKVHSPVWARWLRGDEQVRATMREYKDLVAAGSEALAAGDHERLRALVVRNFDLRARLFTIRPSDRCSIELGRALGAATKLCGSGGAVLVVPQDAAAIPALGEAYARAGYATVVPRVTEPA